MAKTPEQIAREYEAAKAKKQLEMERKIQVLYLKVIDAIAPLAATQKLPKGIFALEKAKVLEARVDALLLEMTQGIDVIMHNGITDMWELSNTKNNLFADIRLDNSLIPDAKKVTFYNPNAKALKEFLKRKTKGLNLSQRVYKIGQRFKYELEAGLGLGISKGQSSKTMARDLKQYVKNPDKLFRRVRDSKGKLQLSKNAKAFHPGKGVYRSSYKNAERLTVSETNMSYRTADMKRFNETPFIIGYEVRLSARHPRFDVCDSLKGRYPVTFTFVGWHPYCICYCVAIMMNDEQFIEYQKLVLAGTDTPATIAKITNRVMTIPEGASKWIKDNAEALNRRQSKPYFITDNPSFTKPLLK